MNESKRGYLEILGDNFANSILYAIESRYLADLPQITSVVIYGKVDLSLKFDISEAILDSSKLIDDSNFRSERSPKSKLIHILTHVPFEFVEEPEDNFSLYRIDLGWFFRSDGSIIPRTL